MSWWNPRTWLRNLFPVANEPGGFMAPEGHELKWERSRLPITVYVDRAADPWWGYVDEAVRWINGVVSRPVLLLPEEPSYFIADQFKADVGAAKGVPGAIYVTSTYDLEDDRHGRTDVRDDQRTGIIRNAYVELPPQVPPWADSLLRHELMHALGLGHGPGLMARVLDGRGAALTPADVARLRAAYGAAS